MLDFPQNLNEFETRFSTEDACLEYVRRYKWPDGFRCIRCGNCTSWPVRSRRLEQCVACGHQESITSGTLFHQTRKPLRLWFRAISLWVASKRGLSSLELSRQLGVHYETAWHWSHRLRATISRSFGQVPLEGVVDVDETSLGATTDGAAHAASVVNPPAEVAGAVEVQAKHLGRVRLDHLGLEDDSIHRFVFETTVSRRGTAFRRSGAHTQIQRVFTLVKRAFLGTFHGAVSRKHLHAYLHEFQFRFNRRRAGSRWLLFQRIVAAAPRLQGLTMRALTHNSWGVPEPTRYPTLN